MINEPDKLSDKMTPRQDIDADKHDDNDNKIEKEKIRKKEPPKISPVRSLDLSHIGAIRKFSRDNREKLESPVSDLPTPENEDAETSELWAKLRCGSLRTEEVAEREKQKQERMKNRQNRCADYPGLAFGSAMFGSDTMMKFNIIKNELHNIMRSQLKRVDGEVNALSSRVKQLDKNLEESENYIRIATAALADTVALQIEESKSRNDDEESESNLSAFDQHVLFLEHQLKEARIKASQSFQILEDCDQAQESLFCNDKSSALSTPASSPTDSTISAADTILSRSSSHNTEQLENIANGNDENIANGNVENITNGNVENMTNVNVENITNGNVQKVTNTIVDETIANGNVAENITNGNVGENITNGNVEENITNGNVDENIANGNTKIFETLTNINSGRNSSKIGKEANNNMNIGSNANCLKTLIKEQDSANANLPL
eukprot:GFUD01005964.1.p1 GENE.GFUD01005964.1~~GFUD01005964.1.p1  ORF type:complete len:437 (-),score=109.54 GFUD01005964.1:1185-2495(-)